MATRLYAILARKSRRAVIFRRGPSKQVALISWDRQRDSFEVGQWFKGRIYERRCDLSPDGSRLVYFAASWRGPYQSWTAISHPPWFTAVALWPNGSAWGGGGMFVDENSVLVNHAAPQLKLAEGFSLPRRVRVAPAGSNAGRGEDMPLWRQLLASRGWEVVQPGIEHMRDVDAKVWIEMDPPFICRRMQPSRSGAWALRMILRGIKERGGPWLLIDHELVHVKSGRTIMLARTDWADWDANTDLLFSRGGALYRLAVPPTENLEVASARQLADFSDLVFEAREAPANARGW